MELCYSKLKLTPRLSYSFSSRLGHEHRVWHPWESSWSHCGRNWHNISKSVTILDFSKDFCLQRYLAFYRSRFENVLQLHAQYMYTWQYTFSGRIQNPPHLLTALASLMSFAAWVRESFDTGLQIGWRSVNNPDGQLQQSTNWSSACVDTEGPER